LASAFILCEVSSLLTLPLLALRSCSIHLAFCRKILIGGVIDLRSHLLATTLLGTCLCCCSLLTTALRTRWCLLGGWWCGSIERTVFSDVALLLLLIALLLIKLLLLICHTGCDAACKKQGLKNS
jgi:hypothetical protein